MSTMYLPYPVRECKNCKVLLTKNEAICDAPGCNRSATVIVDCSCGKIADNLYHENDTNYAEPVCSKCLNKRYKQVRKQIDKVLRTLVD